MTLTGKEKLFLLYKMMYLVKVPKTQLIISSPPHPTILLHSTLKILNITAKQRIDVSGSEIFRDF